MLIRSKLSTLLLVFIATLLAAIAAQANTVYLHQLPISNLNAQFYYQSQIKVKALEIETQLLQLISEKDLDFLQEQSDSSGLLTREIKDKGHQRETIQAALIQAENMTVNGHSLNETLQPQNLNNQVLQSLSSQNELT